MDGIRIPSSRPVVVDSATILVPILKHSMNLEIDAVVVLALKLCQQRIINALPGSWILFCYIFAITNLQSVAVQCWLLFRHFQGLPKATYGCFEIKECQSCHYMRDSS